MVSIWTIFRIIYYAAIIVLLCFALVKAIKDFPTDFQCYTNEESGHKACFYKDGIIYKNW